MKQLDVEVSPPPGARQHLTHKHTTCRLAACKEWLADRQTDSDAQEATMQVAQVGSKIGL